MGMMQVLPSVSVLLASEFMESIPALVMDALAPMEPAPPPRATTADALGPKDTMPRAIMLPDTRPERTDPRPVVEPVPKMALSRPWKRAAEALPWKFTEAVPFFRAAVEELPRKTAEPAPPLKAVEARLQETDTNTNTKWMH